MKIIDLKQDVKVIEEGLIIVCGFFDGLHKAHMSLINKALEIKEKTKKEIGLLTFSTNTKDFIANRPFYFLESNSDKVEKLNGLVDYFYILDVNNWLVEMSPDDFINRYLIKMDYVICGSDFRFGYHGKGDVDLLKTISNFETVVIDLLYDNGNKIGTTLIKEKLSLGDIKNANQILGYEYEIKGQVIKGFNRGEKLGFPTINLKNDGYFLPKGGVYKTKVFVNGIWHTGLTNIGNNPTFDNKDVTIETHILNFNKDIYFEYVKIKFIRFIRDEIKFSSIEKLKEQLIKDVEMIKGEEGNE